MPDSLAKDLGEVPAKDVATFAATDQAAQWIKRIGVTAGAGTLSFAETLLKVSYSSDQRSRTGIFILIATGGKAFIDPISNKIIASDIDTLIKLHHSAAGDAREAHDPVRVPRAPPRRQGQVAPPVWWAPNHHHPLHAG